MASKVFRSGYAIFVVCGGYSSSQLFWKQRGAHFAGVSALQCRRIEVVGIVQRLQYEDGARTTDG